MKQQVRQMAGKENTIVIEIIKYKKSSVLSFNQGT
jgi:hypothetical protein